MIKHSINKVGFIILRVLVCIMIATFLMTLSYLIPTKSIDKNVQRSASIFKREGTYPVLINSIMSQYDNYTDSLILLEASSENGKNPVIDAMNVKSGSIGKLNPTKTLVKHYIESKPFDDYYSYARYWHGHLIIIKPLLYFFDYFGFRIINSFFVLVILLFNIWLLFRKKEKGFIVPYILSMLFLMPLTIAMSIQFSNCYYIMNIGIMTLLLLKDKRPNKSIFIFLYLGIATAFFDFLTYPVATFGVPCALYFFMRENKRIRDVIKEFAKVGVLWCVGYVSMWISKWIIATAITGQNVFEDGLEQTSNRTSGGMAIMDRLVTIARTELQNVYCFIKTPVTLIALVYLVVMIILVVRQHKNIMNNIASIVPFILLLIVPICWYAVATEHSQVHCWFTYKAVIVSALSLLCIPSYLYNKNKENVSG